MNPPTNSPLDLDQLYHDISTTAGLVDVPVDEPVVRQILDVYQDHFRQGSVAFRTTTHPPGKRELSVRYIDLEQDHDPYTMAVQHGLLAETGHPIERLFADVVAHYPILGYGIDMGVSHGMEKIWPLFSKSLTIDDLFKLPSMPPSVRNYVDHFARFDLNTHTLFAIDYEHKTMNIYFPVKQPGQYPAERIAAMIEDLGLEVPGDEELAINTQTGIIYHTFDWESDHCRRLSFGVPHVPEHDFPTTLHPVFERMFDAPVVASERRGSIQTAYTRNGTGDYLKIEIDYTGTMMMALGAAINV